MMTKLPVALGLIAALLLSGCHTKADTEAHGAHEAASKYAATTPLREDTSIMKDYVCQIQAIRHIEVRSLEKGYLQSIFVDEGQLIKKGQPMFKIMPNIYQAELLKAQAEAQNTNIEYLNTKGLADENIVSPNELALAKAKLDKAKAEVKMAETRLGFTDIKAPFEGIMDHLAVRIGSLLDEGAVLTTLSDVSQLWVYFNVPEAQYLNFKTQKKDKIGEEVQLRMADGEIFNQKGVIEAIVGDFHNSSGNIQFRALFANPEKILRHGETGTILLAKLYPKAMLIPQKATFEIMDKTYVYVINKEDKVEQRLIHVEAELPQLFIVKDGLKETDRILLEGIRKVHPGEKVQIDLRPPQKVRSELNKLHTE
ncbi:Membrane fusion protein, multidrug efflux system [Candidatus Nitrotoga sp. HW29]|uniref:efflux RND transporter periplasmic adaptor subunit n=1 Tax=Candidatus Nitrotoga sp. HW29 TaxID=2886963 RepID=UPI001EF24359|nr:efflux RND transporter periplasmic adaptor subunit [Candidatus Nitrotoga sp. HW29]CAH1906229.1 Membrane fusion protein, multidrug efflux system [Candidatus Nitrotoga sp. HW29]